MNAKSSDAAMEIGNQICKIRKQAGMKSKELASELGIDPSAMSNIEKGKRAVKTNELARIAKVLGVSPLAILNKDSLLAAFPVAVRTRSKGPTYSKDALTYKGFLKDAQKSLPPEVYARVEAVFKNADEILGKPDLGRILGATGPTASDKTVEEG